jgi:hypothetical protein
MFKRYPVKLVYMAGKIPQLGSMGEESLTMTFAGSPAEYPAYVSQEDHLLISLQAVKPVMSLSILSGQREPMCISPLLVEAVELGDGSSANIIGKCSLRLNLGPFQDRIVGLVLQNFSQHHDIILGDEFLSKHKAKLDYKHQAVVLYKGNRKFTISLAKTQRLKPLRLLTRQSLLCCLICRPRGHSKSTKMNLLWCW